MKFCQVNGELELFGPTAVNLKLNSVPAPEIGIVPKNTTVSTPGAVTLYVGKNPLLSVPAVSIGTTCGEITAGS